MVFVFSWLVYFIQRGVLKVHLCCSTCQNFLPFKASDASLYVCATAGLPLRGHCTVGHSIGSVVHPPQQRTRVPVTLSPHPCQHTFFSFVIGALLMDSLVFISLMISDVERLFISLMAIDHLHIFFHHLLWRNVY